MHLLGRRSPVRRLGRAQPTFTGPNLPQIHFFLLLLKILLQSKRSPDNCYNRPNPLRRGVFSICDSVGSVLPSRNGRWNPCSRLSLPAPPVCKGFMPEEQMGLAASLSSKEVEGGQHRMVQGDGFEIPCSGQP